MNILITCHKIDLSGSSTYSQTLAQELINRGHTVNIFSVFIDERLRALSENKGIIFITNSEEIKTKIFDVIISQHSFLAVVIRGIYKNTPILFISHGVLPALEQPPSVDLNIYKYIAVSEECRANLLKKGIKDDKIIIIRNFVNTKKFANKKLINEKPQRAVFMSNYDYPDVYEKIKNTCDFLGIKLNHIGLERKKVNIVDEINDVDLVFTLGRGALESMSCGRAVIIFDYNGGDGMITPENIDEIKKNNFSGRRFHHDYNVDQLIDEIKKYDLKMSDNNQQQIVDNFNSIKIVPEIERLCMESIKNFIYKGISLPTKELIWACTELAKFNLENDRLLADILKLQDSYKEMQRRKIVRLADFFKKIIRLA